MESQQWLSPVLAILGVVSIVCGIGLMCWSAVQRKAHAGEGAGAAGIIEAVAKLFDAIGRSFPEGAARIGVVLLLAGFVLVGGSVYLDR